MNSRPQLTLKPLQPQHFATVIGWVTSPQLLMQFAGPSYKFPLTEAQLQISTQEDYRQCFAVVDATTAQLVGQAQLYYPEPGLARLARLIIDPARHGQGHGTQLVNLLCELAHEQGAYQAELGVKHDNFGAIRCYEKCGFALVPERTEDADFFGTPAQILYLTKSLLRPNEPL